jgi:hypothetical protein
MKIINKLMDNNKIKEIVISEDLAFIMVLHPCRRGAIAGLEFVAHMILVN